MLSGRSSSSGRGWTVFRVLVLLGLLVGAWIKFKPAKSIVPRVPGDVQFDWNTCYEHVTNISRDEKWRHRTEFTLSDLEQVVFRTCSAAFAHRSTTGRPRSLGSARSADVSRAGDGRRARQRAARQVHGTPDAVSRALGRNANRPELSAVPAVLPQARCAAEILPRHARSWCAAIELVRNFKLITPRAESIALVLYTDNVSALRKSAELAPLLPYVVVRSQLPPCLELTLFPTHCFGSASLPLALDGAMAACGIRCSDNGQRHAAGHA